VDACTDSSVIGFRGALTRTAYDGRAICAATNDLLTGLSESRGESRPISMPPDVISTILQFHRCVADRTTLESVV